MFTMQLILELEFLMKVDIKA